MYITVYLPYCLVQYKPICAYTRVSTHSWTLACLLASLASRPLAAFLSFVPDFRVRLRRCLHVLCSFLLLFLPPCPPPQGRGYVQYFLVDTVKRRRRSSIHLPRFWARTFLELDTLFRTRPKNTYAVVCRCTSRLLLSRTACRRLLSLSR